MKFKILKKSKEKNCRARLGLISTSHGTISTPSFMPVATKASVKALSSESIKEIGSELIICNTYHLMLRPGEALIKKLGGLHKFMNWNRVISTDSGGFQAFSLGHGTELTAKKIAIFPDEESKKRTLEKLKGSSFKNIAKITDDGVEFTSIYEPRKIKLTPERSIQIQHDLGADIILAFDECTSPLSDYEYTKNSLARTHSWEKRSLDEHKRLCRLRTGIKNSKNKKNIPALFGIVQGSYYKDLRQESAKYISSLDFDGLAIGGSLGKSKKEMHKVLDWTMNILPENKPVHLLGIGVVEDIFEAVDRGIDLFDCVSPTRIARTGLIYIRRDSGGNKKNKFRYKVTTGKSKLDTRPLDENCKCRVCKNYSRAYINHLFKSKELLAYELCSYHNVYFINDLMKTIRKSIKKGDYKKLKRYWLG